MRTSTQTAFRLPTDLLGRLKRNAREKNLSLNAYVTEILQRETAVPFPKLHPEEKDDPLQLFCCTGMPSRETIDADPKLAHLLRV